MISTVVSRSAVRRTLSRSSNLARRWESSSNTTATEAAVEPDSQTQLANLGLAASLIGFCGFVFTYSMNAVGKSQDDPLAALQAEAQDAKDAREQSQARRMTPEEVAALESGVSNRDGNVEIAVAADADIADLEEEANRKVFRSADGGADAPKKKPWWRFGF